MGPGRMEFCLCVVIHRVCICEDALPRDDEAAGAAAELAFALPGQGVVGF